MRNAFDEQELKTTAANVKAKFEEFNVLGYVVQINPGPVVTTFEFKPEAGIKYSSITRYAKTFAWACRPNPSSSSASPANPPSASKSRTASGK